MKHLIALLLVITVSAQSLRAQDPEYDFELLKNLELFEEVYKKVDINYVDEPSPGALMKAAIDAMLLELDPYTVYFPESEIEDYKLMSTGQYGGIGAIIRQVNEQVIIVEPHKGYPADKAGFIAGDVILEIDGKSCEGLSSSEVSEMLKGKPGSTFQLTVERNGDQLIKPITREEIKLGPVPFYGMVNDDVGYIKLNSFTQTAGLDVLKGFKDLKKSNSMNKCILDLRGNGGGLLIEAVKIVNMFVPKGSDVVAIKGRTGEENREYKALLKPEDLSIPLVVVVDGGSASASEIVSGALQDLDRAVIVGETSFGKGLVQRPLDLKYNAKMKVTIAKYYTPSGRCIQKLDYSNREVGSSATAVSEEYIKKFKTKNGREVIDGRGVEPDVKVDLPEYSRLTATLVVNNIIFDFATQYFLNNESIAPATEFTVDDALYTDFVEFALKQDFEYTTASGDMMELLKETAEKESYYQDAQSEYDALFAKFQPSKEDDLEKFKPEIKELIGLEIVGRYYYEEGRIAYSLVNDKYIEEAVKILNDNARYKSILNIQD
ncbi:MAG: S41 family peptidase [Crocinitomicaceae bacterium]|nr:S41 family peptidase [Crocinitomicaceae bacterium]